jgi:hypothetical protein
MKEKLIPYFKERSMKIDRILAFIASFAINTFFGLTLAYASSVN